MAILGIAAGAIRVGQKLLGGIRKRQERKKEKRAARAAKKEAKLAAAEGLLRGRDSITQSGNSLVEKIVTGQVSDDSVKVDLAGDADQVRDVRLVSSSEPGGNNVIWIIIAVAAAFFLLKK